MDELDNFLAHYGVKGMKWNLKKPGEEPLGEGEDKAAILEDTVDSNSLFSTTKTKRVSTEGGEWDYKTNYRGKAERFINDWFGTKAVKAHTNQKKIMIKAQSAKSGRVQKFIESIFKR